MVLQDADRIFKQSAHVAMLAFLSASAIGQNVRHAEGSTYNDDACELLLAEEVSEVLALPVGDGVRENAGLEANGSFSSTCFWPIEPEMELPDKLAIHRDNKSFAILHVMRWPRGSGKAGTYIQAFRDAAQNGEIPTQPEPRELGDESLWWGDGLAVRDGETSFGISVRLPSSISDYPGSYEEQLAKYILNRLNR